VELNDKKDKFYYSYAKDLLTRYPYNFFSFGRLRSRAFFDIMYGDEGNRFKALVNAGVNFGANTGSLYSEIVSGNLGIVRVALGTMVSSTSDAEGSDVENKTQEAYQRLVTYGGNTVLTIEYPLIFLHSRTYQYNFVTRFVAKGTADFPAFGTNTEDWAGSGSAGLYFYADAALDNNDLRFFADFNYRSIYGSDIFTQNLGLTDNNFGFGQLTVGLVLFENVKLSVILATVSSEESLTNKKIVLGGQVLR
jgi:hypothetical protein